MRRTVLIDISGDSSLERGGSIVADCSVCGLHPRVHRPVRTMLQRARLHSWNGMHVLHVRCKGLLIEVPAWAQMHPQRAPR